MAKQRKKALKTETPPRVRKGQNLNVWVSDAHMEAFEAFRASTRRSIRAEVEVMIEEYLKDKGLWPPTDTEEGE